MKRRCVLIVDDEPAIPRIISLVLRQLGCQEIYVAQDAEEALKLLEKVTPDLIITDIRLPGLDGIELTERVRSLAHLQKTPVLLMSAFPAPQKHSGDAFISKPFDIDHLSSVVSAYLG